MSNDTLEIDDTTIIISDLHLSSDICQAKLLDEFLAHIDERCNRLIINGDLIDSLDFNRLKKKHWKILSDLRKLSNKIEVIWVEGNHDIGASEIFSHLLGISVVQKCTFVSEEKRVIVMHGHTLDTFWDDNPWLTLIGDYIYRWLQWIDPTHKWARLAKYQSKHYLRCMDIMREKALKIAKEENANIICLGHSHSEEAYTDNGLLYLNSGSFCEIPAHYIQITNGFAQVIPYGPC